MSGDLESKTGRGPRGTRRVTKRSRAPRSVSKSADSKLADSKLADDSGGSMSEDSIDEAGRQSFPASDPPTWTLGVEPRKATH